MKQEYLGDCFDFYKRWFLQAFFPSQELLAFPMFTEKWNENDKQTYADLLHVKIIQNDLVPLSPSERRGYFRPPLVAKHLDQDLFVDPDTGLRVEHDRTGESARKYLFIEDLDALLDVPSSRVAVVYDHSIARAPKDDQLKQVKAKLKSLRASRQLCAFAYCAQVSMIVLSKDERRIKNVLKFETVGNAIRQRIVSSS